MGGGGGVFTIIWEKQLGGISCGLKARDPELGTNIEKNEILEQLLTK